MPLFHNLGQGGPLEAIGNQRAARLKALSLGTRPDLALIAKYAPAPAMLFDFSRTDLTFQEATGQTPADDAGEAVALALEMGEIGDKTLAQMPESLPNSTWAGAVAGVIGAGGSLPTGWEVSGSATTVAVNGLTTDSEGAPALDITIETVNGGGGSVYPRFRITPSIASAVGASWRATSKIEIVSLSSNNAVTTNNNVRCNVVENDSGGFYVAETNSNGVNSVGIPTNTSSFRTLETGPRSRFHFSVPTTVEAGKTVTLRLKISLPSFKKIPGYHAIQSGSTGARPTRQANGLTCDASDDNLLSSFLNGAAGNTILFDIDVPATVAAAQIIMGSMGTTSTRFYVTIGTSGIFSGAVGSQASGNITGVTDYRGQRLLAALRENGSLVTLRSRALGTEYSGAQVGVPNTNTPVRLGCLNNAGTPANFFGGTLRRASSIHSALSDAEIDSILNYWSTL